MNTLQNPLAKITLLGQPLIYQIGLCFERLRMLPKAHEAYRLLVDEEEWENSQYDLNENLLSIKEMAVWRLGHIDWLSKTESGLLRLLATSQEPEI